MGVVIIVWISCFNTPEIKIYKCRIWSTRELSTSSPRALFAFPNQNDGLAGRCQGLFPPHLQSQGKAPWGRGWGVVACSRLQDSNVQPCSKKVKSESEKCTGAGERPIYRITLFFLLFVCRFLLLCCFISYYTVSTKSLAKDEK